MSLEHGQGSQQQSLAERLRSGDAETWGWVNGEVLPLVGKCVARRLGLREGDANLASAVQSVCKIAWRQLKDKPDALINTVQTTEQLIAWCVRVTCYRVFARWEKQAREVPLEGIDEACLAEQCDQSAGEVLTAFTEQVQNTDERTVWELMLQGASWAAIARELNSNPYYVKLLWNKVVERARQHLVE